jgi:hypothetical protein
MSISENPLVGHMRKSMGNFTMYTYYDKNIVRLKAFKIKDPKTEKQLIMRARMTLMAEMYKAFRSIIALGFPENSYAKSPQNMFVSVNFNSAFVMIENVPAISYTQLLLSKGSLPAVKVAEAITGADGITLRYDAHAFLPDVISTDEIIACARLITGGLLIARQFTGIEPIGTILLKYPALQAEDVACCYIFVRSGDGKKTSDSVYVPIDI